MAKYSYHIRREFLELPGERHEELMAATKLIWWSCTFVRYAAALVLPLAVPIGLVLGIRALFPALPSMARILVVVFALLAMYFGPKLILRFTQNVTLNSMQGACLRLFAKQRSHAG